MQLMMRSKKGLGMEFIITVSLVLISFFLIAGLLGRFLSQTNDKEAELLCQNSVALRAKTALNIGKDISKESEGSSLFQSQVKSVPTLCKTVDKKVAGSREQIIRQVADSMARCWWMFGEGRYDEILDNVDIDLFPGVLGLEDYGPNQCFNCYTILVDQDEISGGSITSQEISDYLAKNVYAKVNKTYLDYIQGQAGPGRAVLTIPELEPRKAYAISIMPKNQKGSKFWTDVLLSTTSIGHAYVLYGEYQTRIGEAYNERDVSSIFLGPLENAQKLCGDGDIAGQ